MSSQSENFEVVYILIEKISYVPFSTSSSFIRRVESSYFDRSIAFLFKIKSITAKRMYLINYENFISAEMGSLQQWEFNMPFL